MQRGLLGPSGLTLLAIGWILALAVAPSAARTLAVPTQHATIGAALQRARPGDLVLVACGTYQEAGLEIPSGVRLWSGTLQPACTVIDAGGRGRIFTITGADSTTAIVGFTLRGGQAEGSGSQGYGGAILCRSGQPRITNCRFEANQARSGGALYVDAPATPRLEQCAFIGNVAANLGGAILWEGRSRGFIKDLRCETNQAFTGGALYVRANDGLLVQSAVFTANLAANSGGALVVDDALPRIENAVFDRNSGGLGGGGVAVLGSDCQLIRCTFYGNTAEHAGGAVITRDASPRFDHSILAFHPLPPVAATGQGTPRFSFCNVYGNEGGDWIGPLADQEGANDNFALDPLFCDPRAHDFSLAANSWCLPGQHPGGRNGQIGARGRGCPANTAARGTPRADDDG